MTPARTHNTLSPTRPRRARHVILGIESRSYKIAYISTSGLGHRVRKTEADRPPSDSRVEMQRRLHDRVRRTLHDRLDLAGARKIQGWCIAAGAEQLCNLGESPLGDEVRQVRRDAPLWSVLERVAK